jgi:hypothetical protein
VKLNDYINKNDYDSIGKSFLKTAVKYAFEGDVFTSYTFIQLGLDNVTCDCFIGDWFGSQKMTKETQIKALKNSNTKEFYLCYSFIFLYSEKVEGYLDKAMDNIEKYLKISPDYLGFYLKGRILAEKDRDEEALKMYEKSYELDNSSRILYRIGRLKEVIGINGTKELFSAAIKNPHSICCCRVLKRITHKRNIVDHIKKSHNPLIISFLDSKIEEWEFQKLFKSIIKYDFSDIVEQEKNKKIIDDFYLFLRSNNNLYINEGDNQKSELTEGMLIGSKWKIKHIGGGYGDAYCTFLRNNVLEYKQLKDWKWYIINNQLIFEPINMYSKFICELNENSLTGNAENKEGKKWKITGENLSANLLANRNFLTSTKLNGENSKFRVENQSSTPYKWYALWQYFPVNRFPANSLSTEDLNHRNLTFDFKDGVNPDKFAEILSSAINKTFDSFNLKNKILIIIPASNKIKTEVRFKKFCEKLCSLTGLTNGYDILVNNDENRIPVHKGGDRNKSIISAIKLKTSINGKELIIIDDVRTSGKSSNDVNELLIKNGAKSTTFIYVGKTVSSSTFVNSIDITQTDAFPF